MKAKLHLLIYLLLTIQVTYAQQNTLNIPRCRTIASCGKQVGKKNNK